MIRVFTLLLLLVLSIQASVLKVGQDFTYATNGAVSLNFEDVQHSFSNDDVLLGTNLKRYPKNYASYSKSIFWSSFDLQNSSNETVSLVLSNPRAGMDEIDVFLYQNNNLVKKHVLGDLRSQNSRFILSAKSVFYLTLKPNEPMTIVSRYKNLGSYDFTWEISSTRHYSYKNSFNLWFWGIFGGLMIALMFYNLVMYANLKKVVFLFYVIHAALLLWFQYAFNGILYFLNIGIDLLTITLSTWFVAYLMISALNIFTILFFDFYRTNRPIYTLLGFMAGVNFLLFVLFLFTYIDTSFIDYTNYFMIEVFTNLLILLLVAMYSVYKGYAGAWYYLLGEGIYVVSLMYLAMVIGGKTASGAMEYAVPVAVLIEALMFSLALGSWVKTIRNERDKANLMIINEARFVSIGKSIGMAVHQWKEPLSQLGSQVLYLRALAFSDTKGTFPKEIKEHIGLMSETIVYMKETVNDVYDSCTNLNTLQEFQIFDSINLAYRFQKDRLTLLNIDLKISCSTSIKINSSKNTLANIFMTLIDNSIAQFEQIGKAPNQTISITVNQNESSIEILFEDNAGGISTSPISNIFEIDYTTKGENGSGMGLALVKLLVEKRLNGSIDVENTQHGARFTIAHNLRIKNE